MDKPEKPLVSFVMPAYNAGKFISEAIDSIRSQTEQRWELVIVDDGSTDDTPIIISHYASLDPRIRSHRREKSSGSAYQPRKEAILNAEAEMIAPLDADDWIDPDYLARLLLEKEQKNVDLIYPTMLLEEKDNSHIVAPRDNNLFSKAYKGRETVILTLFGWRINCNGGIIKRSIYLEAYKKFGDEFTYQCADEYLSRQLLLLSPSVAFSETIYHYRSNPESITRRISLKRFDFLTNNLNLIRFTADNFGKHSDEYLQSQKMNFYGIFDAYRLLNKYPFTRKEKEIVKRMISDSRKQVNLSLLHQRIGHRYYYLYKFKILPLPLSLKILDRLLYSVALKNKKR